MLGRVQPRNGDTDLGRVPSLSLADPPGTFVPAASQTSQQCGCPATVRAEIPESDRGASVMGLLVSGYTGKVRRKLVFPWTWARAG